MNKQTELISKNEAVPDSYDSDIVNKKKTEQISKNEAVPDSDDSDIVNKQTELISKNEVVPCSDDSNQLFDDIEWALEQSTTNKTGMPKEFTAITFGMPTNTSGSPTEPSANMTGMLTKDTNSLPIESSTDISNKPINALPKTSKRPMLRIASDSDYIKNKKTKLIVKNVVVPDSDASDIVNKKQN